MAFRKLTKLAVPLMTRNTIAPIRRQLHKTTPAWFLVNDKPAPRLEDIAVGYEKITLDAAEQGEDPFELQNRDEKYTPVGTGTRSDPFLVPSRNKERYVMREAPDHSGGPPVGFWVTLDDGGRCPATGDHYKLNYDPTDKWGIDELDLFSH